MRLDGQQRCLMPTRNVNLTNEQDKFVAERVKSGIREKFNLPNREKCA